MSSSSKDRFEIIFWGVRGTLATPGRSFEKAGGNTNCIEIRCGDRIIIIDAGTGIRELGGKIAAEMESGRVDLLLTHAHFDHVEGIPFFAPLFSPSHSIHFWGGELDGSDNIEHTVRNLMKRPYFPVGPEVFSADLHFEDIVENQSFDLGDGIKLATTPLNHPGGATGYRIDYAGKSFACITDTEHIPGKPDQNILGLIKGVDLFVYDASLTDRELPDFTGYGHSTWEEAARLHAEAGSGGFLATHHMPFRTDSELDSIERQMRQSCSDSGAAREGQLIRL